MPGITIEKLPDEPIVIMTVSGDLADMSDADRDPMRLHSLLDTVPEPVFLILDMNNATLNLEDLMRGASDAFRGDKPFFKHSNVRQILQVSNDLFFEMAANTTAANRPHPKSFSLRARDFQNRLPVSLREKGPTEGRTG